MSDDDKVACMIVMGTILVFGVPAVLIIRGCGSPANEKAAVVRNDSPPPKASPTSAQKQSTVPLPRPEIWPVQSASTDNIDVQQDTVNEDYELIAYIPLNRRVEIYQALHAALRESQIATTQIEEAMEIAYRMENYDKARQLEHQIDQIDRRYILGVCAKYNVTELQSVSIQIQGATENWPK